MSDSFISTQVKSATTAVPQIEGGQGAPAPTKKKRKSNFKRYANISKAKIFWL